jgi:hypothetical protein
MYVHTHNAITVLVSNRLFISWLGAVLEMEI